MSTLVKICGLKTPETMSAALEGGADFVGLVFHPTSPRYVEIEVAKYLASYVPDGVKVVGLFVDPTDERLQEILGNVRIDMIQLHGNENPSRVSEIKNHFGKPIIKAIGISSAADLKQIDQYMDADWLLLDSLGGGTGKTFDWGLLKGFETAKPWMLAGGLDDTNVAAAIRRLNPTAVDVSGGVESMRGVKDAARIRAFIEAAKYA